MKSLNKGITIIEIMVVVAIVGLVTAMGIPAFKYYIQNTRAITLTNTFTSALAYARSEAVTRGKPVTICAASNSTGKICGQASNWTNGWIIFIDPDSNGIIDKDTDRLRVQPPLPTGTLFTTTEKRITYDTTGYVLAGSSEYELSAEGCKGDNGRNITLSKTGTPKVTDVACE